MNTFEKKLKEAKLELEAWRVRVRETEQALAEYWCPHIIGDKLINKDGVVVELSQIKPDPWGDSFTMMGRRFKKDGVLYAVPQELYTFDEWKAKDETTVQQ